MQVLFLSAIERRRLVMSEEPDPVPMETSTSTPEAESSNKTSTENDAQIEAANTLVLLQDAASSTATSSHSSSVTRKQRLAPKNAVRTATKTKPSCVRGNLPLKFYYELFLEKQEKLAWMSRHKKTKSPRLPQINVNRIRRNAFKVLEGVNRSKLVGGKVAGAFHQKDALDILSDEILKLVIRKIVEDAKRINRQRSLKAVKKAMLQAAGNRSAIIDTLFPQMTRDHVQALPSKEDTSPSVSKQQNPLSPKMSSRSVSKFCKLVCISVAEEMAQEFSSKLAKDDTRVSAKKADTSKTARDRVSKQIRKATLRKFHRKKKQQPAGKRVKLISNALRRKNFKIGSPSIENLLLPLKPQLIIADSSKVSIPKLIVRAALRNMQWKAKYATVPSQATAQVEAEVVSPNTNLKSILSSLNTVPKGLNLPALEYLKVNFPTLRLETIGDIMRINNVLTKTLQLQHVLQSRKNASVRKRGRPVGRPVAKTTVPVPKTTRPVMVTAEPVLVTTLPAPEMTGPEPKTTPPVSGAEKPSVLAKIMKPQSSRV